MQHERYCRNCGQELKLEDRYCVGCGRPVHATTDVPAPEADVPVSLPVSPQAPISPPQEQQPGEAQVAPRGTLWGMLGVFLVLGIVKTIQGMPSAPSGSDIVSRIGFGMGFAALIPLFSVAALILLIGGVYYAIARKDGLTFREAIFNWPLVIVAGVAAVLFPL